MHKTAQGVAGLPWALASASPRRLREFKQPDWCLDFSPDGTRLAVAFGIQTLSVSFSDPGQVVIFDVGSGEAVKTLSGHNRCVRDVAYSPDGTILASTWDVATGKEVLTLRSHAGTIFDVAFRAGGSRRASVSGDEPFEFGMPGKSLLKIRLPAVQARWAGRRWSGPRSAVNDLKLNSVPVQIPRDPAKPPP